MKGNMKVPVQELHDEEVLKQRLFYFSILVLVDMFHGLLYFIRLFILFCTIALALNNQRPQHRCHNNH